MTTVAVRPGAKGAIAADTLVGGSSSKYLLSSGQSKLSIWPESTIACGVAGHASDIQRLRLLPAPPALDEATLTAWALGVEEALPGFWERSSCVLLDLASGAAAAVEDGFAALLSGPYAIGSGEAHAMGAMAMGASPARAVEVAGLFDDGTGGETHSLQVVPKRRRVNSGSTTGAGRDPRSR